VLASQAQLPREAVEAGCDAAVDIVTQLGVDEYQQTKHNGGITTCSIKSTFAKRVVILASFLGGDHHASQKTNLATDPSADVLSVFKQMEILMETGFLVLDCSTSPLWGQVRRVFVRIHPLLTSDWPSLLAMSSLGKLFMFHAAAVVGRLALHVVRLDGPSCSMSFCATCTYQQSWRRLLPLFPTVLTMCCRGCWRRGDQERPQLGHGRDTTGAAVAADAGGCRPQEARV
jgi:hypothetical protein